jgi:protein FAM32A
MPSRVRLQALREGYVPQQPAEAADRRTLAERKFDDIQAKREAERVAKLASKSHRDRVNDFNAYLANLSEHHDIPRVGPG